MNSYQLCGLVCSLLSICVLANGSDVKKDTVAEFQIGNAKYKREILVEFKGNVYDMAVSHRTGTLYFALFKDEKYQAYLFKKGKSTIEAVTSVQNGQCALYDPKNDKVYFGTDEGLSVYNEDTGEVSDVGFKTYDIWDMAYSPKNDEIIFIDYDTKYTHAIFRDRKTSAVVQRIENILAKVVHVDSNENYYYQDVNSTLYALFNEFTSPVTYQGVSGDVLALDNSGIAYVAENDRLFLVSKYNVIVKMLAYIGFNPTTFVFDNHNNMYFGADNAIVKYSTGMSNKV